MDTNCEIWIFWFRRLPKYQLIAERLEQGAIPLGNKLKRIESEGSDNSIAYGIFAAKPDGECVHAELLWGGGFPVKHVAYVYSSCRDPKLGASGFWHYRRMNERWFEVHD